MTNDLVSETEYRSFLIRVFDWLDAPRGKKCYYRVVTKENEIAADTLWNDDKMWNNEEAIESAKRHIDKYIASEFETVGYFMNEKFNQEYKKLQHGSNRNGGT